MRDLFINSDFAEFWRDLVAAICDCRDLTGPELPTLDQIKQQNREFRGPF